MKVLVVVVVVVLAVLGLLAAITAAIYLAVPIHSLPSFIPGKHRVNGHYHKRGAAAALVALVLFVASGGLVVYFRRTGGRAGAHPREAPISSEGPPVPGDEAAEQAE